MNRTPLALGSLLCAASLAVAAPAQAGEKGRFRGLAVLHDTEFTEIKLPEEHPAKSMMLGAIAGAIFNDERKPFLDKALYEVTWAGDGTGFSYCFKTFTAKDGGKVFARCEATGAGRGYDEGVVTLLGGTGRYAGIKGKGKYHFSDVAGKVHWDVVEFDYEIP
jgi:hypothetical protein